MRFFKICLWYFSVSCSLNGEAKMSQTKLAFSFVLGPFFKTKAFKCSFLVIVAPAHTSPDKDDFEGGWAY